MALSIQNLLVAVGVAYDSQLRAADNLFFAAAVQVDDPTKPMFGGSVGDENGNAVALDATGTSLDTGYASVNNPIDGDPVTIRQLSTPDGPRFVVTDGAGEEIMQATVAGGAFANGTPTVTPRYQVKADGFVYDSLQFSVTNGWEQISGGANPNYTRLVGRISFKAKEGATLSRASDELQRATAIVSLLTRLLEGLQDEQKGFADIIR